MSVYINTTSHEELVRSEAAGSSMLIPSAIVLPAAVAHPDYLWYDCSGDSLD